MAVLSGCDITLSHLGPSLEAMPNEYILRHTFFFFKCPVDPLNSGQVVGCTVVDIQYWRAVREPSLFDFQASVYLIADFQPELTTDPGQTQAPGPECVDPPFHNERCSTIRTAWDGSCANK